MKQNHINQPMILLENPKYPHNVGAAIRAASCFGSRQVWYTGSRMNETLLNEYKKRLPREERMKGYKDVELINDDRPFDKLSGTTPVAIEIREDFLELPYFIHPPNALYVFGPEDGSISKSILRHCHYFVVIPARHCLNLSAAIYVVLYDRMKKEGPPYLKLAESRGYYE